MYKKKHFICLEENTFYYITNAFKFLNLVHSRNETSANIHSQLQITLNMEVTPIPRMN